MLGGSVGSDDAGANGFSFAGLNGTTGTVGTEAVTYSWDAATHTLTATGPRGALFTVEITNAATGAYKVTLLDNVLHASGPNDENSTDSTTSLTYTIRDADNSSTTGTLTITFDDDAPVAHDDGNATTEGGAAVNGNVLTNDAVGADQPGTVIGITGGAIGTPIVTASGTLTLNGNGTYSYTPKASVPSGTVDSFTYTMKDADGDTSTAVLSFTFAGDNDHATAGTAATRVDEDDLASGNHDAASGDDAPTAQPGTLGHNYGLDGPGSIALVSGSETVNGVNYTYTANAGGTVLTANDGVQNVFQVNLTDAVAGSYTVTLLAPVKHLGSTPGFEDNLDFHISYAVKDSDDAAGATGTLTVTLDDDVPVAHDDGNATTEGGAAVNGNVLTNDAVGADQPGTVIGITGGAIGTPIVTASGTLTLNGNGTYSYTPKASVPSGTVDSFTYTMKDADGDTSTAVLSFTFAGDNDHATAGTAATRVDEDDLASGNHDAASGDDAPTAQPGTLGHNYGLDGPGSIALVSGSETVNGVNYTYTANAGGTVLTANDGVQNVFQVNLTDAVAGTYTVTLLAPVKHLGSTPGFEDNLDFHISYAVKDSDDAAGATGTLTVTLDDDDAGCAR